MSKKQKIDLKTPDAFHTTSDKIFMFIEDHAKTVLGVALAVVVTSLAFIGYGYLNSRQEAKAAEALFAPEDALRKAQARVLEAKAKATAPPATVDKKKPAPPPTPSAPRSFADDYGSLVDHVEAAIKDYASTRVALVTAMNTAYFLVLEKQPQKALDVLNAVRYRPGKSDILAGFFRMHRGLVLLETGAYKEALDEYQAILDQKALAALHPEALLKLAVAQEMAGDVGKARETYERVTREYSGSEASSSAGSYLRLLDLKGKKG